jgi:hypothetical protein
MGGSYVSVEVSSHVDLAVLNKPVFTRNKTILHLKLVTYCGICCLLPQNKNTNRLLNVVAMEIYPLIILCRFLYIVYCVLGDDSTLDCRLVRIYLSKWRYISTDVHLDNHYRQNLESHVPSYILKES